MIKRHATGEQVGYNVSNSAEALLNDAPMVQPGDTVVVPRAAAVYMVGDVNRPGAYVNTTTDDKLTALHLLALAGSTPPTASPAHARLIHKSADGSYTATNVDLSAIQKGHAPDFPLEAGRRDLHPLQLPEECRGQPRCDSGRRGLGLGLPVLKQDETRRGGKKMPRVSVVILTRNRPQMVLRAVSDALAQTLRDLEVIVVIDGPDEATATALAGVNDRRLRVVQHDRNRGISAARNTGFYEACGDYVALQDDDDEWQPP